jgi:hypothetical protein
MYEFKDNKRDISGGNNILYIRLGTQNKVHW